MTTEERLRRIEAHLFGKAEQPPTKERTFEAFYVHCTREEYSEVKAILQSQGYVLKYMEWMDGEDCVSVLNSGVFYTYRNSRRVIKPVYTLPQLREKFGVEQPQEQLRDFVVPLEHATLTREEVAARCVAAAEKKGYRAAPEPDFSDFESHEVYFSKDEPAGYFETKVGDCGYGVYSRIVDREKVVTLEAFEEYCGVEQPPTGNSENPNTHEATAQPVYDAGFWFSGQLQCLSLSDCTKLWYSIRREVWVKDGKFSMDTQPHTITPVETHTVGKFYALAGIEPNHLSDWRSYALCVKNEDVPYFVRPTSEYGIVSIDRIRPSYVSLNEVTPL